MANGMAAVGVVGVAVVAATAVTRVGSKAATSKP
jgi:hypothetical protein